MTAPGGPSLRDELLAAFPELSSIPPPAWFVGGASRDLVLGRPPADVDLAAEEGYAAAEALAAAGGRIVPLGRERFPTWRVIFGERACDVSDVIGATIEEDLGRRDFTINAIALPLFGPEEIIDPFGGADDIGARRIRMVARRNLVEDPLRVLKAVRLAATLGFTIDPGTLRACAEEASRLGMIAGERVGAELEMTFSGGAPAVFGPLLRETGIDEVLFGRRVPPFVAPLPAGDPVVVWAAIYLGGTPDEIRRAAKNLRWPAALASSVAALLRSLAEARAGVNDVETLDAVLYDAGRETAGRIARLAAAAGEERLARAVEERLTARGAELFSIAPLLNGEEIGAATGLGPGPGVGALKRELLLEPIAGRIRGRDDALAWLGSRRISR
ncbi:MAG TPA: hypothetical protein VGE86_05035 [Thermoanaerobaculia bacterium]